MACAPHTQPDEPQLLQRVRVRLIADDERGRFDALMRARALPTLLGRGRRAAPLRRRVRRALARSAGLVRGGSALAPARSLDRLE